jgi:hypothetical protein
VYRKLFQLVINNFLVHVLLLESFEKINKRLKRLTSGLATTWEESESEKMLGVGKRKKIPSSKLQDAEALVVVKPRRGNPQKVTYTTTENGIFYIFLFMLIL